MYVYSLIGAQLVLSSGSSSMHNLLYWFSVVCSENAFLLLLLVGLILQYNLSYQRKTQIVFP